MRTKTDTFLRSVTSGDYDVIGVTETWLTDSISDGELLDSRYNVFRRDRSIEGVTMGGGVLLAVKKELNAICNYTWCSTDEDIWVTLRIPGKNGFTSLHLCCIYLSKSFNFNARISAFSNDLGIKLLNQPNDKFLIMGDFNLSDITWSLPVGEDNMIPCNYTSTISSIFIDNINYCNFHQYNGVQNTLGRILDLVLCNFSVRVAPASDPLVPEDTHHKSIIIIAEFVEPPVIKENSIKRPSFHKANYDDIRDSLAQVDWNILNLTDSVNPAVSHFYNIINNLISDKVPLRRTGKHSYPPWYSSSLIKLIREKQKIHRLYITYKNPADYITFSRLRTRQKKMAKKCHEDYIKNAEENITKDPKAFWSYVKSKKLSASIPSRLNLKDITAEGGQAVCDLFADYFHSVYEPADPLGTSCDDSVVKQVCAIGSVCIDADLVSKYLKRLDPSKGAGPDGIPPLFITECANHLSKPLSILFNTSLKTGTFPDIWKRAYVTPIHKSGNKCEADNYRPISKLCIFSKVFENIVYDQLFPLVKNSINEFQHGFFAGRSVATNLITFINFLSSSMDKRVQVDTIYTDYSKAFDKINHNVLLRKLSNHGIHGDLLRWLSSYVTNRSQAVTVGGFSSIWKIITSGVPQGSILGPLLFTIYINDIVTCFHNAHILLFADDMKIYLPISSPDCSKRLQEDLDRLTDYCFRNKLFINISKCCKVTFTRNRVKILHDYTISGLLLTNKDYIRDLGVLLDSKLTFDKHVDSIVTKATKSLGFVLRTCKFFKNTKTYLILYNSHVRPHLEYCSQVWNPRYIVYVNRLERVQERFLKFLNFKSFNVYNSYDEIENHFRITKLHNRRLVADQMLLYKIINSKVDCPELLNKINFHAPTRFSRQNTLFYIDRCNTNSNQNEFLQRTCNYYNNKFAHIDTLADIFTASYCRYKISLYHILGANNT